MVVVMELEVCLCLCVGKVGGVKKNGVVVAVAGVSRLKMEKRRMVVAVMVMVGIHKQNKPLCFLCWHFLPYLLI